MVTITTPHDLSVTVANFSDIFNTTVSASNSKPHLSSPLKDEVGGVSLSITWPCLHGNHLIGVVGLDIHLGALMEEVTYFSGQTDGAAYTFVVDRKGRNDLKVIRSPDLTFVSQYRSYLFMSNFTKVSFLELCVLDFCEILKQQTDAISY